MRECAEHVTQHRLVTHSTRFALIVYQAFSLISELGLRDPTWNRPTVRVQRSFGIMDSSKSQSWTSITARDQPKWLYSTHIFKVLFLPVHVSTHINENSQFLHRWNNIPFGPNDHLWHTSERHLVPLLTRQNDYGQDIYDIKNLLRIQERDWSYWKSIIDTCRLIIFEKL